MPGIFFLKKHFLQSFFRMKTRYRSRSRGYSEVAEDGMICGLCWFGRFGGFLDLQEEYEAKLLKAEKAAPAKTAEISTSTAAPPTSQAQGLPVQPSPSAEVSWFVSGLDYDATLFKNPGGSWLILP